MFSSKAWRLASPDLRARCSTGPGSSPGPTAVPSRDRRAHGQKNLHGGFGGALGALQFLEQGIALRGAGRGNVAVHDFVGIRIARATPAPHRRPPCACRDRVAKNTSAFFTVSASRFAANALNAGASNTSMRKHGLAAADSRLRAASRSAASRCCPGTVCESAPASRPARRALARGWPPPDRAAPRCRCRPAVAAATDRPEQQQARAERGTAKRNMLGIVHSSS